MTPARRAELEALCKAVTADDSIGLMVCMLDVDRLNDWARNIATHGADISQWGSPLFVQGKLEEIADGLEHTVHDVGKLRAARTALPEALAESADNERLRAEVDRLTAQVQAFGDVLPGDVIRYPLYMFGCEYDAEERTVEVFRGCLGVFRSGNDRTAGRFTPLCELYKPGPESTQGYIPNYGEYQTGPMVPVWTVVSRLERLP